MSSMLMTSSKRWHRTSASDRKIARTMEKKMTRKKRASEIAADPPELSAPKVGVGGGSSGDRNNDHRPLVKNHFKDKVWQKAPYDR